MFKQRGRQQVVSRSILVAGAILGFIGIITFLTLIGATPA
jgi:hypothetical protein